MSKFVLKTKTFSSLYKNIQNILYLPKTEILADFLKNFKNFLYSLKTETLVPLLEKPKKIYSVQTEVLRHVMEISKIVFFFFSKGNYDPFYKRI